MLQQKWSPPPVYSLRTSGLCLCLVTWSCLTLCDPVDCSLPGYSVHGDSSGKNPGVGCHALLQGIFPPWGSNPGLPHCRWIIYQLSHQGSPGTSVTSWEKEINTGCCSPCGHETLQLSVIIHPMSEEPKYQRSWRTLPFK